MKIRLYLNTNTRDSFVKGYQDGDMLCLALEAPAMSDEMTLDEIYEANQNTESFSTWYQGRSLSKGDVIVLDDRAYAIAGVGFEEIDLP